MLITLGIIGVVATMTITVLVPKVQDMQFKEAAKEAFSKASQAVQLMKNDNGGHLDSSILQGYVFGPMFNGYFKTVDLCPTLCVQKTSSSTVYKTLIGNAAQTWWLSQQFVTADGMFWGVYGNGTLLYIIVDVNGYGKGPNIYGRDVFFFEIYNDNLLPMGGKDSANTAPSFCNRGSENGNMQGIACMYYVMQGTDY